MRTCLIGGVSGTEAFRDQPGPWSAAQSFNDGFFLEFIKTDAANVGEIWLLFQEDLWLNFLEATFPACYSWTGKVHLHLLDVWFIMKSTSLTNDNLSVCLTASFCWQGSLWVDLSDILPPFCLFTVSVSPFLSCHHVCVWVCGWLTRSHNNRPIVGSNSETGNADAWKTEGTLHRESSG